MNTFLFTWLLALLPILSILLMMVAYRWGAAKAGGLGWFVTAIIAVLFFGGNIDLLALAQAKALFATLDVLLIIWAAFLLFRVADEAGAVKTIGQAFLRLTSDRGMQVLLVAWPFASFLQGVGGFGVPVAVTAPLLLGLGFSPLVAVVAPSLGHGWSVTFGSLASSFQAMLAASGISGQLLGPPAAILLGFCAFGCGLMVVHMADGWRAVGRLAVPGIAIAASMALVQYLLVTNGLWNVGGFGAGMVGLALGSVIAWISRRKEEGERGSTAGLGDVALAFSPYLILIAVTLLIEFVTPLRAFLGQVVLRVPFPEMRTSFGFVTPAEFGRKITLFTHAGAVLFYTSALAYVLFRWSHRYKPGAEARILGSLLRQVMSSSVGIAAMVSMAVIMSHVGMTDTLARGLAAGMGQVFPLASPWIGALGAFTTGSNTNSNVVFTGLQMRTADLLGLSIPVVLAAQTAGAALGSVMAPTKIVVGASTAGMAGREGDVLRALLVYVSILILGISLAGWVLLGVWPR